MKFTEEEYDDARKYQESHGGAMRVSLQYALTQIQKKQKRLTDGE